MNRNEFKDINGWLIIDKPSGINSTRVVSIIKKLTKAKKVGHAGTLDPMASGILPIALGEATKAIQFLFDARKTYQFTVTFGAETDTDDADGKIVKTTDIIPTKEEIIAALPLFIGTIEQVPPVYSAIKVDGKRSYDLARKGQAEELKARKVEIFDLKLLESSESRVQNSESKNSGHWTPDSRLYSFEMTCGKGTYVRSLGRDLARKLGSLGHISTLRRTRVGNFDEKNAILLEKLEKMMHTSPPEQNFKEILPVEAVLDGIPVLHLNPSLTQRLKSGRSVFVKDSDAATDCNICVLSRGKIAAIAMLKGSELKPVRVFNH